MEQTTSGTSNARAIRVVSLFSGCGGGEISLRRASKRTGVPVEVVAAYDSWDVAVRTYNANHTPVAQVADIKTLDSIPDCDLVIGGPPCQPFSIAGKQRGANDERDCIPDFLRLAAGKNFVMENVRPRLISAPWSAQLYACDYGDATIRRRWYYSNLLIMPQATATKRVWADIREDETPVLMLTAHHAVRVIQPDEPAPGLTHNEALAKFRSSDYKRHGARPMTTLEMQRAHSYPEDFDWNGATKAQISKMIANSWPVEMGAAVLEQAILAIAAMQAIAA